jgi:cytochrome c553
MPAKDVGDLCTSCHRDTGAGSGLWVNRIPSLTESEDGYLCRECQACDEPNSCFHDECVEART